MAKIESTVELLDKLSANLKTVRSDIVAAQAELDRIKGLGDKLLQSARREAQNDAAETRENMLKAAKVNCAGLVADARAEADKILREARDQAAKIVAEGTAQVHGLEAAVITERAKALLSERAAA
jgi:vacuolar-type H+-ATPase subunit H